MNKINTLSIDIETYSDVDLSRSGVYRYAESKNSELLLFSYSVNDGPVKLVDTANGEKIPSEIIDALLSDDVKKWAFNASFERVFLSYYLKRNYPNLFKGYGDELAIFIVSGSVEPTPSTAVINTPVPPTKAETLEMLTNGIIISCF